MTLPWLPAVIRAPSNTLTKPPEPSNWGMFFWVVRKALRIKLSLMSRLLAVKLFRLTWDEPIKAMPFVLTRMTLALWPVAWVRIPAMTLGSLPQMRLSVVKLAPCTKCCAARLSTC